VSCIGFQKPVEEPRSRMKTPKPGWTGHICSANDLQQRSLVRLINHDI